MTFLPDVIDASTTAMPSLSLAELGRIFAMLSDAWVSNFLMVSAPYEEAKLLMEPVQNMHKMSGEHVFTVNKAVTGLEEPKVLSRWLSIPVCNRGSKYAAGFFIQDKPPQMHFVRFVRDDQTGQVIYITEIPETGSIEVMHTLLQGSKRRRSAYLRFDSLIFREVVSGASNHIDISKLMDALVTSCMIAEVSTVCKRCGSGPEFNCHCELGLRPAEHALDFRFYRPNSDHMFGNFQGVMTLSTYANGQERSCQSYRVQNFTQASSQQFSQGLLHEAVRNRLKLIQAQPSNLTMPNIAAHDQNTLILHQQQQQQLCFSDVTSNCTTVNNGAQTPPSPNSSTLNTIVSDTTTTAAAADLCSAVDQLVDICNSQLIGTNNNNMNNVVTPRSATLLPAPVVNTNIVPVKARIGAVPVARNNVIMDKAMLRKIKKREAAERSNSRRHLRRIELKQQLKEMREKETTCKKRIEELKGEREILRMRLDAALLAEEMRGEAFHNDLLDDNENNNNNFDTLVVGTGNDVFAGLSMPNISLDFRECAQLAEAFS